MRQSHDAYDPALIRRVLSQTRTIALVGASANPARPSHHVMAFLLGRGYRVIPVNPGLTGQTLLGQPVVARLAELGESVDMVEIFRSSDAAGGVVDEALALAPPPRFIWMQIGVRDDAAAARAEAKGCVVVMDRCPKIEIFR
jgi:predicted CoA-binding protein